ncbi:hypothetical protein E2C01_092215 [Portunus trituberculatus]|uniref:Uncharacterized protein n=1 Tax=Portunus trituberculatus TaxID=210409 RepID=A0A5B7JR60_PORTR|nr:hypothetical protein [Portunus trituberculatus]
MVEGGGSVGVGICEYQRLRESAHCRSSSPSLSILRTHNTSQHSKIPEEEKRTGREEREGQDARYEDEKRTNKRELGREGK